MKIAKIILAVCLSLAVLLTAGLYIFLKTFDVNKFLPEISRQAAQMTGRELHIGRAELSFSFSSGIGLQVRDVVLSDDPQFSDKPFLTVDQIEVGLNPGAFILEHKIQLVRVVIMAPKVVVIRSQKGLMNVATIGPKASPRNSADPAAPPKNAPPAALPALFVNDIKVVGARVTYVDEMFSPRLALQADRIDAHVRNFSLTGPFAVTVKAALFSSEQDVHVDAQLVLDLLKQAADIRQMSVQADLGKFDVARLVQELPMLDALAIKKVGGTFKFTASDIQVSPQGLSELKGKVELDAGSILSSVFPVPVENMQMQADLDEKQIRVSTYSASVSEGTVKGAAVVADYASVPSMQVTFDAQGINVKKIAEGYKAPVAVSGLVSAAGDIKFSGTVPDMIMGSLNGQVKGELEQGVLENVNLLALGLGNIPMLPGLLDSVLPELPAETQDEVKKGITRFETCKMGAHIVSGLMQLDTADIVTRDLGVHAAGTIKLVDSLSIKADIRIAKDLSERLAGKVKELAYLEDEEGRIYMPFGLEGAVAKPKFVPDVEYLTKRLVVAAGGEQLQKALGGNAAAAEAVGAIFDLFKKK